MLTQLLFALTLLLAGFGLYATLRGADRSRRPLDANAFKKKWAGIYEK